MAVASSSSSSVVTRVPVDPCPGSTLEGAALPLASVAEEGQP